MSGKSFIKRNSVGIGSTTAEGRDAGIGTAVGEMAFVVGDSIDGGNGELQIYTDSNEWKGISTERASAGENIEVTGGISTDYTSGGTKYRAHIFTGSGSLVVSNLYGRTVTADFLVVGGGGAGGQGQSHGAAAGGGGGYRTSMPEGLSLIHI